VKKSGGLFQFDTPLGNVASDLLTDYAMAILREINARKARCA
jgi:hypothetical protein